MAGVLVWARRLFFLVSRKSVDKRSVIRIVPVAEDAMIFLNLYTDSQ
jgi:hypothetical protein